MATSRDIRRLAFQTLYQLDARGRDEAALVRESLEGAEDFTPAERQRAFDLAQAAHDSRGDADRAMEALAPTWPARRQAAVDRAILRLAYYEMVSGRTEPKIAVNEAVELAKAFSTDKSPAFINALLDKILKRVLAQRTPAMSESPSESGDPRAPGDDPAGADPPVQDAER